MKKILILSCVAMLLACTSSVAAFPDVGKDKVPKTELSVLAPSADILIEPVLDNVFYFAEAPAVIVEKITEPGLYFEKAKVKLSEVSEIVPVNSESTDMCIYISHTTDYKLKPYNKPLLYIDVWKDKIKQC